MGPNESLTHDQSRLREGITTQRHVLEQRLASVRRRMDQAYQDKLDGKLPEAFWERNMGEWHEDEQRIQSALARLQAPTTDRMLDTKRILELANKAYSLYLTQNPAEQARLLRMVLLNCAVDGVSVQPTYRKPFDLIFQRAKKRLVGTARFELATPCTPSKCATRLRYVPMKLAAGEGSEGFDLEILHQRGTPGEGTRPTRARQEPSSSYLTNER